MKQTSEMTLQELKDLVSYKTEKGYTLFYSDITMIDPTLGVIEVKGSKYRLEQDIDKILEGMNTYKVYQLLNSQIDIESVIRKETHKIVNAYHKERLDALLSTHTDLISKYTKSIKEAYDKIIPTLEEVEEFKNKLSTNIDNFDLSEANDRLKEKIDSVQDARDEIVDIVKPAATEVKNLVDTLHKIVKS